LAVPLQSSCTQSCRLSPFGETAHLGSCPHRDTTKLRPLDRCCHRPECRPFHARRPRLTSFRPQAFSTSRRFTPHLGALGLFHPKTTSRVHSCSGRFSSTAAVLAHHQALAPLPLGVHISPTEIGCQSVRHRLRGFTPPTTAFLQFGVTRPFGRCPLQVLGSSGFRAADNDFGYPRSVTHDVTSLPSEADALARLQRSVIDVAARPVSGLAPRSSFRAYDSIFKELEPLRLARI
jgi:hypothetical protein